jgi:2-succinyl-5-enolpyruvyl-6-hydroxy-3-cyclohexene-1-carboxylate synthase
LRKNVCSHEIRNTQYKIRNTLQRSHDTASLNEFWARLIVEELVRCGTETFFVAPGSRSTPLVLAVARHPEAQAVVHYDERGSAFAALGYARATADDGSRPAAWITTSGTAVANGLPAVVEAGTDAVPMLLLTTDRPPERRDTASNQTIDQPDIFGDYARWQFDLPAPTPAIDARAVLTTVDQAAYRARRPPAGPVHLNCMFRKPLQPDPSEARLSFEQHTPARWHESNAPLTRYELPQLAVDVGDVAGELQEAERGLIVAGRLASRRQADAVSTLAEALGWPVLADVGSHLRLGSARHRPPIIGCYDQLLASEAFAERHRPDAVLHVGGRFVSKRLRLFLAKSRPPTYVLATDTPFRVDPEHQVTRRVETDPAAFCDALAGVVLAPENNDWLESWQSADRRADERIDTFLEDNALSEPRVLRLVTRHLPEEHGLVLASSMPVRDADRYAATGGPAALSSSNRGASGIDGTVATAAGFARGLRQPATLVIGDLALLHDLNSLMLLRRVESPVTVVVLNNRGGGIFSFLPIAEHEDVFEPFFGTPHDAGFEHAAAQFDLTYHRPDSSSAFRETYRTEARSDAPALIEVRTERDENRALHGALETAVRDAIR